MTNRGLASLIAVTLVVGCGEPRIDASSEEALQASVASVRDRLNDNDRRAFDEALEYLTFQQVGQAIQATLAGGDVNPERFAADMMRELDRLTANEIIETAQQKQRDAALEEIAELRARLTDAKEATRQLAKFEVTRSRLTHSESFVGRDPIIELGVRNGTDHPVSRAYFRGIVSTAGRSVPWINETFNYQIPGGA